MCTAITYKTKKHYFGRNLDVGEPYGEKVLVVPRNYNLPLRCEKSLRSHYAIIGMGIEVNGFPLYFDATNEKGLSAAGLNFPQNAYYFPPQKSNLNITPFEIIPWILSLSENCREARKLFESTNIVNVPFSDEMPLSPLHWIVSDKECSLTVESTKEGLKVYDNPLGILTNNPPFLHHLSNVKKYSGLSNSSDKSSEVDSTEYSLGTGAVGLPGDFSSKSRFVKALFVRDNSPFFNSEEESVNQFFHILSSVSMPKGSVKMENGCFEYTRYSTCTNVDEGILYFTTYEKQSLERISLYDFDLNSDGIISCADFQK